MHGREEKSIEVLQKNMEEADHLEEPRCRLEDNIKMDLKEDGRV
jgi:hypothetical protein